MFPPPFELLLVHFSSLDFTFGRFVTSLPESVRQDELSPDKEEAEDAIDLNFELEDLIRLSQVLELALIPDLAGVAHASKQRSELLLNSQRKLFEPFFSWYDSVRDDKELYAERRTVIDQSAGRQFAGRKGHSSSSRV